MPYEKQIGVSLSMGGVLALLSAVCLIDIAETVFLPLPTEIGDSFEFDLQLTVPYSIILPTWVGRRCRRQTSSTLSSAERRVSAAYKMNNAEGVIAARLESMFSHLGIHELACQKRLLCLISQNPQKYTPLSDIILQHLIPLHSQLVRNDVNCSSAMWQYIELYEAGKKGFSLSTNCTQETVDCSKHPDHGIDWSILSTWQILMKFINIRFD